MRMFYNLLVFSICLNFSAYVLPYFISLPTTIPAWQNPTDLASWFSFSKFGFLLAEGAAIGLAALLLRQGTYAVYAMLLGGITTFAPIISGFFLAIPSFIDAILPAEMNPIAPLPNPISLLVNFMFVFAAFMFFIELMTQRNIS